MKLKENSIETWPKDIKDKTIESPKSKIESTKDIEKPEIPKIEENEQPKVIETHSSPLLLKNEKEEAAEYGYSLDSKKVDETIGIIDIENICKWLAHAVLKHIDFSKGEVLIDDLVAEDEDIPQFSYDFDYNLRIDLEELQRKREMEEWEAQVRNIGNILKLDQS